MNIYKRQNLQKLVIQQSGHDRLILNDLILGLEGAQAVAQLIPQYHPQIQHIQIKGNNIDSQGFEMLFMALMNCQNLKSISAEWNSLGTSPAGIISLCYLVKNLPSLEFIDLKNNRISHQLAEYVAELIQINNRALTVLDLRWNQLGQIGAQVIYTALPSNSALKYIGLEDNRISTHTLLLIDEMLKNTSRGMKILRHSTSQPIVDYNESKSHNYFPISDDAYPSMDVQVKTGQLRTKIEHQNQEAELQNEKTQIEIQKILQKIRVKGAQMHQLQLKYQSFNNQNLNILNKLREEERILALQKQRCFGIEKKLNADKAALRAEKYNVGLKTQTMMQKLLQTQQRQLEDLDAVMSQKLERLKLYLKDRLNEKRINRQKLVEIKEDIIKFKLSKQAIWDKVTSTATTGNKGSWEDECSLLEDIIAKAQSSVKAEAKKGTYLAEQLSNAVLRGLQKEQKFENDIFEIQNKIKQMHRQMTFTNVQSEENEARLALKESQTIDKEANVDLRRRYVKYIQSQNTVNQDIERLKNDEDAKRSRVMDQTLELRIADVEKAFRTQQAQNKMLKNQYEKMQLQLQSLTKKTIQSVLFEQ